MRIEVIKWGRGGMYVHMFVDKGEGGMNGEVIKKG